MASQAFVSNMPVKSTGRQVTNQSEIIDFNHSRNSFLCQMQVNGINFRVENRYYIVPLVLILQILLSSLIRQLSIEGSRQNLTGKHHNHIKGANSFTERRISWSSIIINYALNSGVCWIASLSRRSSKFCNYVGSSDRA